MAGFRRRGDKSADIDVLFQKANRLKRDIDNATLNVDNMMSNNTPMIGNVRVQGTASGATILGRRRRRRGEFTTLGFYIDPNCTSITLFLLPDLDNMVSSGKTTEQLKAIASANRYRFDDITDDERTAGFMTREIGPLDFLTRYGITRTVSRNDESGLVATVKDPEMHPYTQVPVAYVSVYDTPTTPVTNGFATFSTCDQDGLNCGTTITPVVPRPHPTNYVLSQRVTPKGVKPTLQVVVPKNATSVAVRLVRQDEVNQGNKPYEKAIRYKWDILPSDLIPVSGFMAETDARIFSGRFGEFLDFDATYDTIRIVCEGDNVDGQGNDIVRNPVSGGSPIANGTFTAGASQEVTNPLLKEDTPFVSMANNPTTGLPIDFILKKRGVKAIFHMLIPDTTTKLTARVAERSGTMDVANSTLSDSWDDIVPPEMGSTGVTDAPSNSTQIKIARRFGPTLDFNTQYRLKRLVAEGDNIGSPGIDKAVYIPATAVTFTTPDSEGNFNPVGGNLSFGGVVGRRFKKNGVFVKMRINIPRGTQRVIAKIQNLADQNASDAKSKVLEYSFEDIDDTERSAGFFDREFGIKLEAATPATDTTPVIPVIYGVVRLAAFGDNVNASGNGGKNPDVFRVPANPPTFPIPTPSYLGTFSTTRALGYVANDGVTFATCPAVPVITDLTNGIDNDAPVVSMRVFASQFRTGSAGAGFPSGTGPGGSVTFSDVGAEMAGVIVNRSGDPSAANKISQIVPITDLNSTFIDVEIPGLVEGKRYFIPRVILMGSGEISKTQAIPPTTSVVFNAGFSIDVTLLQNFSIPVIDALDARSTNVSGQYTVPINQNILPRNIVFEKDVIKPSTGIPTGYKEFATIELKSNKDNGLAGQTRVFTAQATHPAMTQIRYRVTINPVKNGAGPITAIFPTNGTYIQTGMDAGMFMDTGPPSYTNGASSRFRVKWKPDDLRVRCNLPNNNMQTFKTAKVTFRFEARVTALQTNFYLWNPNSNETLLGIGSLVLLSDDFTINSSPFYVDVGRAVTETFEPARPIITGSPPSASYSTTGGLPTAIANDLLTAFNAGRTAQMTVTVFFFNNFDPNSLLNSSLSVSGIYPFPFTGNIQLF